ncbi:metal ABC transporter substrate-binding protein [candidate division WOR-3 bacterium]|nr:metal ABC transporter substrate-binding protein [candidate division WOR-3 bacterium]
MNAKHEIFRKLSAIFLVSVLFVGCRTGENSIESDFILVSSIFPISQISQTILGDSGQAEFLVKPGSNPHVFEPKPSDAIKIFEADILFCVSEEFDGWMVEYAGENTKIIFLDSFLYANGGLTKDNPHLWLSLKNARLIAEAVKCAVSEIRPESEDYYELNYKKFNLDLDSLEKWSFERFYELDSSCFIQWHPAWDYIAMEQGLKKPLPVESGHGDELSAGEIKRIIDFANENDVRVIVVDANTDRTKAENLARNAGAVLVVLDPLGNPEDPERSTYLSNMKKNIFDLTQELRR